LLKVTDEEASVDPSVEAAGEDTPVDSAVEAVC